LPLGLRKAGFLKYRPYTGEKLKIKILTRVIVEDVARRTGN
jgi:hypothetical protein